jgi:hypothetical protein
MPAAAQPAPSPHSTAAGWDVVVIDSSDDDEMQQQGQSRSQGRAGVNLDASTSIIRYFQHRDLVSRLLWTCIV